MFFDSLIVESGDLERQAWKVAAHALEDLDERYLENLALALEGEHSSTDTKKIIQIFKRRVRPEIYRKAGI